jgi:hypothetical protein
MPFSDIDLGPIQASTYHVRITESCQLKQIIELNSSIGIRVSLKQPIATRPCIKLIVDGTTSAKRDFDGRQLNIVWDVEPPLYVC